MTCGPFSLQPFLFLQSDLERRLAAGVLNPARLRACSPARRWVLGVLASRVRAGAGAAGERPVAVMEPFQYAMFCLLVYMCFGGPRRGHACAGH